MILGSLIIGLHSLNIMEKFCTCCAICKNKTDHKCSTDYTHVNINDKNAKKSIISDITLGYYFTSVNSCEHNYRELDDYFKRKRECTFSSGDLKLNFYDLNVKMISHSTCFNFDFYCSNYPPNWHSSSNIHFYPIEYDSCYSTETNSLKFSFKEIKENYVIRFIGSGEKYKKMKEAMSKILLERGYYLGIRTNYGPHFEHMVIKCATTMTAVM